MVLYCPTCHTAYNNNLADKLVRKTDPDHPDITSNMVFECPKKNCYGTVIMLDDNIVPFIDRLHSLGAITLFSCAGHYEENYYSPYIDILDNSEVCPFTKKLLDHVDYKSTILSPYEIVRDDDSGPDYSNQLRIEYTKTACSVPRLRFGSDGIIHDVRGEIIIRLPNRQRPASVSNSEYAKERFDHFRSMLEDYLNLYGLIENIQDETIGQKFDTELCERKIQDMVETSKNPKCNTGEGITAAEPINIPIAFKVGASLKEKIENEAQLRNLTVSEYLRQAVSNPSCGANISYNQMCDELCDELNKSLADSKGSRSLKSTVKSMDKQEVYEKARDVFAIPMHLEPPIPTVEDFFDNPFMFISPYVVRTLFYRFKNSTDNDLSTAARKVLYNSGIIIDSGGFIHASKDRKRNYILSLQHLVKAAKSDTFAEYESLDVLRNIFRFYNKFNDDIRSDESSNTPNTKE